VTAGVNDDGALDAEEIVKLLQRFLAASGGV